MQSQFESSPTETRQSSERLLVEREPALVPELPEEAESNSVLALAKDKIRRRKRKYFQAFLLIQLPGWVAVAVVAANNAQQSAMSLAAIAGIFGLTLLLGLISLIHSVTAPLTYDVDELVRVGGVRAIPALLEAMGSGLSPKRFGPIYAALTQLLPQMKASDAYVLTAAHRKQLNLLLSMERYDYSFSKESLDFKVAILKAYEQVGDRSSLKVVQNLAKMRNFTGRAKRLREAAQECLPHLVASESDVTLNLTLLRGSQPEAEGRETLLRSAESSGTPEKELLRSTE